MKFLSFCNSLSALMMASLFGGSATYAESSTLISCVSKSDHKIFIELNKPSKFGVPLHCVTAPYMYDLTSCSPDVGWGLSRGTGLADLVEITTSWEYAHSHVDGKFRASLSEKSFAAAASVGEGLPNITSLDESTIWIMTVDRITGKGLITGMERIYEDGEYKAQETQLYIQCFPLSRMF